MFQLQPDATFDANVRVTRPGGDTTTLRVSFRYLDEDEYLAHSEACRHEPVDIFAAGLVAGWEEKDSPTGGQWEGLPLPCNAESLKLLRIKQPRVLQAMVATWLHEVKGFPLKP